jgi:hypothetical protein
LRNWFKTSPRAIIGASLTLISVLLAALALARDYFDWEHGTSTKGHSTPASRQSAVAVPSKSVPGDASFVINPQRAVFPRCGRVDGSIGYEPHLQFPWIAWKGTGAQWYLKRVGNIDPVRHTWSLDLRVGTARQDGQKFTVIPIFVSAITDRYLRERTPAGAQGTRQKDMPPALNQFAGIELMRGTSNCRG